MAIVQNPIIGQCKGLCGNQLFTSLKKRNIIKQPFIPSRYSVTQTQLEIKEVFTYLQNAYFTLQQFLHITYKSQIKNTTSFAKFFQKNKILYNLTQHKIPLSSFSKLKLTWGTPYSIIRSYGGSMSGQRVYMNYNNTYQLFRIPSGCYISLLLVAQDFSCCYYQFNAHPYSISNFYWYYHLPHNIPVSLFVFLNLPNFSFFTLPTLYLSFTTT